MAGTLIGGFTLRERGTRNVLRLGLSDDPCMHLGHLARAFHVSDESLRLMRLQREEEGLAAVVARAPGGKEQKVQGDALHAVERLFARGATLCEVQAVGTWLLLGVVNALGLCRAVEKGRTRAERKGRQMRTGTVRVAVDALIAALAVGQRCVEGVRRLQTATAEVLLRAAEAPSASWVRRVLGYLAGEGGAAYVGLGMAGTHIRAAQEASAAGRPTVFYVDNHMRRYTGQEVVRKG